ncbi:MAG TPA: ribonuclease HI, partial [Desulfobulbus sp.]|nr:ribonuclease HI [Desulfobulbus sp.]
LACIKGLEALKYPCEVSLYSDSRYVVDGISKGWAARWRRNNWMRTRTDKAVNVDLWQRLLELVEQHRVRFHWVRGHAGTTENETCDRLATSAARGRDLAEDEGYR